MFYYEIFRIVAKWQENCVYKLSWKSVENWLNNQGKANFDFVQSSTVGLVKYIQSGRVDLQLDIVPFESKGAKLPLCKGVV